MLELERANMEKELYPEESFDSESMKTIDFLIKEAEGLLTDYKIKIPQKIEFYDSLKMFTDRILNQVRNYGLRDKNAREFIKASLNEGTYGTFNIEDDSIIEMNYNPFFKKFYPAIQFLKLIIHESLHLHLYSKLNKNIYDTKFKFKKNKFIGDRKILQLDEGFATFFTNEILKNYNLEKIKTLPIYSELDDNPKFDKKIKRFNKKFTKIYQKNTKKGYKIIKKEYLKTEGSLKEKINLIIEFIIEKT